MCWWLLWMWACVCVCFGNMYTGTVRLPWLRILRAFSSVVWQMPGQNSQRRGTAFTLPNYLLFVSFCYLRFLYQSLCSMYCLCANVYCTVLYCTTATGCQPNCSSQYITHHNTANNWTHSVNRQLSAISKRRCWHKLSNFTVLHCTALHCTVLYCTVLLPPGVNQIAVHNIPHITILQTTDLTLSTVS